jgi:predicted Zn-dependent peptidase
MSAKAGASATGKPRARAPFVAPPEPSLVFQPKQTEQYHLCLSAPGIARSDRRRFTASILDSILGGSASSRLFQEIREKRGLATPSTRSPRGTPTPGRSSSAGAGGEPAECVGIVAEQIGELAEHGPAPDELERAKENLKTRIMLSMEATSNIRAPACGACSLSRAICFVRASGRCCTIS